MPPNPYAPPTLKLPRTRSEVHLNPQGVAPTAQQAPQPQARRQDPRGAPGSFVNFSQRFNANKDVAKREAAKYGQQATAAAGKAATTLQGAQAKFANGVNTGTVAPPPGSNAPAGTNTGAASFADPFGGARPTVLAPTLQQPTTAPAPQPTGSSSQALTAGTANAPKGWDGKWASPEQEAWDKQSWAADLGQASRPTGPRPGGDANAGLDAAIAADGQAAIAEQGGGAGRAPGMSIEEMLANAWKKYSGPAGLDTEGALTDDTLAADQQLDAITSEGGIQELVNRGGNSGSTGSDAMSGALIGAAGRQNFDALRAKFNPNKDLHDAQDKAMKTAKDAKGQSEQNASAWGKMAGAAAKTKAELDAANEANDAAAADRRGADDAAGMSAADAADKAVMPDKNYQWSFDKDTPANRTAYMMTGVDQGNPEAVKKRQAEIDQYMKAQEMTTQNIMDATFGDFNSVMSPSTIITHATGNKDQTQKYAQDQFNKGGTASASGSTDQNHIPWDKAGVDGFFVWRQMTPKDWAELNKLPRQSIFGNDQKGWISTKARLLREARANKTSAPTVGRSQS